MNNVKRQRQKKRLAMGYDPHPPLCGNCTHLVRALSAHNGEAVYRPPYCNDAGIPVSLTGVCDLWKGKNGEGLV